MSMDPFDLTDADLRAHATTKVFERGVDYWESRHVHALVQRGDTLLAEVEGSFPQPYQVRVVADGPHVSAASCSCPYDWGGWCKHIVAVLLAYSHDPQSVEKRLPFSELLEELSAEQIRALVAALAERDPTLVAEIEEWIDTGDLPERADPYDEPGFGEW